VGMERGPLSLVSTTEELLGRNSSDSGLENREYGLGDPLRWPRDTPYPQKLALTSPASGGRSVGILRLRAKATEFVFLFWSCRPVDWAARPIQCSPKTWFKCSLTMRRKLRGALSCMNHMCCRWWRGTCSYGTGKSFTKKRWYAAP
jgi:hypothetical protein